MGRREELERLAETPEERLLLAKAWDRLYTGAQRNVPAFTNFLSLREQDLVRRLFQGNLKLVFFGGFPEAERNIACFLPDYWTEDQLWGQEGPIACIHATYFQEDRLSHRDFLGGLVGSGIRRDAVGDISVYPSGCDFFLTAELAPFVLQNFQQAGRSRLHLDQIPLRQAKIPQPVTQTLQDTLASPRLDSVIGAGFHIGRSQAQTHVTAGRAFVNGALCEKPDRQLRPGDIVSVRSLGKIRLTEIGNPTRKGRLPVRIEKFI